VVRMPAAGVNMGGDREILGACHAIPGPRRFSAFCMLSVPPMRTAVARGCLFGCPQCSIMKTRASWPQLAARHRRDTRR
jgi:hypothetical protein